MLLQKEQNFLTVIRKFPRTLPVFNRGTSEQLSATIRRAKDPTEFGANVRKIFRTRRLGEFASPFLRVTRVFSLYPSAFFEQSLGWIRQTEWTIERYSSLVRERALLVNRTEA